MGAKKRTSRLLSAGLLLLVSSCCKESEDQRVTLGDEVAKPLQCKSTTMPGSTSFTLECEGIDPERAMKVVLPAVQKRCDDIKRLGFERIEVVGNGQSWTYIVEAHKPCVPDV